MADADQAAPMARNVLPVRHEVRTGSRTPMRARLNRKAEKSGQAGRRGSRKEPMRAKSLTKRSKLKRVEHKVNGMNSRWQMLCKGGSKPTQKHLDNKIGMSEQE